MNKAIDSVLANFVCWYTGNTLIHQQVLPNDKDYNFVAYSKEHLVSRLSNQYKTLNGSSQTINVVPSCVIANNCVAAYPLWFKIEVRNHLHKIDCLSNEIIKREIYRIKDQYSVSHRLIWSPMKSDALLKITPVERKKWNELHVQHCIREEKALKLFKSYGAKRFFPPIV